MRIAKIPTIDLSRIVDITGENYSCSSSSALIAKVLPLCERGEHRLLIIDDTVEPKRGKLIGEAVNISIAIKRRDALMESI